MQPKTAVSRIFFPTANSQCSLYSKKNPIIQIFCISGWLAVPINLGKWSSTVYRKVARSPEVYQLEE